MAAPSANAGELGAGASAQLGDDGLVSVAQRARSTKQKIRVEGYARAEDKDRKSASLANATAVRDGLVRNGVPLSQNTSDPPNLDAGLIDAGPGEPDLPASPQPGVRSMVLIVPEARSRLQQLSDLGFSDYLVKPMRQSSLAERLLTAARTPDSQTEPEQVVHLNTGGPKVRPPPELPPFARRILMAEDNPINAMLMRELLQRRGYSVPDIIATLTALTAASIADAYTRFQPAPVGEVILLRREMFQVFPDF
jgi:CheY-like chemotaxis protein